jgi:hypothetical protein
VSLAGAAGGDAAAPAGQQLVVHIPAGPGDRYLVVLSRDRISHDIVPAYWPGDVCSRDLTPFGPHHGRLKERPPRLHLEEKPRYIHLVRSFF